MPNVITLIDDHVRNRYRGDYVIALRELIAEMRDFPDLLRIELQLDPRDPGRFCLLLEWRSEAARTDYFAQPRLVGFRRMTEPWLDRPSIYRHFQTVCESSML